MGYGRHHRLVFGLEELREKAVIRRHRLRDSTIEVLKLPFGDLEHGRGPVLERVDDDDLRLAMSPPAGIPAVGGSAEERTITVVP